MVLLAACLAPGIQVGDLAGSGGPDPGPSVGDTAPAQELPGDTAESEDSAADSAAPAEDPHGCAAIYAQDLLPEFSLDFEPADWAALALDFANGVKDYHPASFAYEGQVYPVHVRLKGNPGFSWFTRKYQFVISFNEDDPDARFMGLRKIVLDGSWYEPTLLRDRLSWWIMRQSEGLPSTCANNALLYVDGSYYGAFANVEYYDHEWLERVYGKADATGTLWKYGSEPTANPEAADHAKLGRFWATTSLPALEALGDPGQWLREWAAEAVLGDDDGYWCCAHNFYLYDHPSRGIEFVPWDFDDDFEVAPFDSDPVEGYYSGLFQQPHFRAVLADPEWRSQYVDELERANALMDPAESAARLAEWDAQIRAAYVDDPHRSTGVVEHDETVGRIAAWIEGRHAMLESWIACDRGSAADADGDGYPVCADIDDGAASIHPGATETCNGRDDDQDGVVDDDPSCEDCARHDMRSRAFLYCRHPRTYDEAAAHCAARGGELGAPLSTGEYYAFFFWTWPVREAWWIDGTRGASCPAWDEASFRTTTAPCTEAHPSVCVVEGEGR